MNDNEFSYLCPNCNKFLTIADKTKDLTRKIMCKHCRKWIWFNAFTGKYEIREVPPRTSASGKRFY